MRTDPSSLPNRGPRPAPEGSPSPAPLTGRESAFWSAARAEWKRLAGDFDQAGFSFEWHRFETQAALEWGSSFHAGSVEICLNLRGRGFVDCNQQRITYEPDTSGFLAVN